MHAAIEGANLTLELCTTGHEVWGSGSPVMVPARLDVSRGVGGASGLNPQVVEYSERGRDD